MVDETKCPGCGLEDEDDTRGGSWQVFYPSSSGVTYAEFGPCKRCGWTAKQADLQARRERLQKQLILVGRRYGDAAVKRDILRGALRELADEWTKDASGMSVTCVETKVSASVLVGCADTIRDLLTKDGDDCDHDWVDASNEAITSGEWCPKCDAIRAVPAAACEYCGEDTTNGHICTKAPTGHLGTGEGGTILPTGGAALGGAEIVNSPRPETPEEETAVLHREFRDTLEKLTHILELPGSPSLTSDVIEAVEKLKKSKEHHHEPCAIRILREFFSAEEAHGIAMEFTCFPMDCETASIQAIDFINKTFGEPSE